MKYRIKNQTFQPIRLLNENTGSQILLLPRKSLVFKSLNEQLFNLAKMWVISIKRIQ